MPLPLMGATRTLSNSIESIILTISLYYWIQKDSKSELISRLFITLNFLCRATSLIPWPGLFLYRFIKEKNDRQKNLTINIAHAILSLMTELIIDSLYY